jgi:hypothetical protein
MNGIVITNIDASWLGRRDHDERRFSLQRRQNEWCSTPGTRASATRLIA